MTYNKTYNFVEIESALAAAESTFDIILKSSSGKQYPNYVPIRADNTFAQILQEYGRDLDLKLRPGQTYRFGNARLGISTTNAALPLKYLWLEDGDKLVIS